MGERRSLGHLAREPLYNTAAVAQSTGVPADTFRAWERRYGFPRPIRTEMNQRLYSERDMGVIGWLRERTDEGMTISQAIQRIRLECPELFDPVTPTASSSSTPDHEPQVERLRHGLLVACAAFDAHGAQRIFDEALASLSVEAFCANIVEPALREIGERWSRGEWSIAAEHVATRLLVQRLAAIFATVTPLDARGTILTACPSGEEHEVGLLVLAIALSRRGWRVVNLGANVPSADIVQTARAIHSDLVCLSATTEPAVVAAEAVARALRSSIHPSPLVVAGGHAFRDFDRQRLSSGAHVVRGAADDVVERIISLIEPQRAWSGGQRSYSSSSVC